MKLKLVNIYKLPSVPNTFAPPGNRTRDLCSLPDDATHLTIQTGLRYGELGGHINGEMKSGVFRDKNCTVSCHCFARINGLPVCEDGIILRSFFLAQCRRVTDRRADRQTNGRTEMLWPIACSHRRHGLDKTVLSCPCRRCEHNCRQDKTVLSCLRLDPVSNLQLFSLKYI